MYKFVHNCESTPVFVRDDVLPEILSSSIPVSKVVQMNINER